VKNLKAFLNWTFDKALNKAQIKLEMKRADKASHKYDECRYQLKDF
jgi:hypothetical protein